MGRHIRAASDILTELLFPAKLLQKIFGFLLSAAWKGQGTRAGRAAKNK